MRPNTNDVRIVHTKNGRVIVFLNGEEIKDVLFLGYKVELGKMGALTSKVSLEIYSDLSIESEDDK